MHILLKFVGETKGQLIRLSAASSNNFHKNIICFDLSFLETVPRLNSQWEFYIFRGKLLFHNIFSVINGVCTNNPTLKDLGISSGSLILEKFGKRK